MPGDLTDSAAISQDTHTHCLVLASTYRDSILLVEYDFPKAPLARAESPAAMVWEPCTQRLIAKLRT